MAMAAASNVVVLQSLLGLPSRSVGGAQVVQSWAGISQSHRGNSSRRSGTVVGPAFSPARLVPSTRGSRVRTALQTDVFVQESSDWTKTLENLKELVELEGGNTKDADDRELLRFLQARSFDAEKAAKAFVFHQKWRSAFVPKGYITEDELPAELGSKKSFWISQDKRGRPVMLVMGKSHVYNKDVDEFKRFVVYAFDRLLLEAPPGEDKIVCIVDLQGLGYKNLDSKSFIAAFEMMQNHYPARLDKVFMINVPAIFYGIWKVVAPFLTEETRNRIMFVSKNKLSEALSNEIDIQHLPKEYGGQADLVLLQDALTPNWPPSS